MSVCVCLEDEQSSGVQAALPTIVFREAPRQNNQTVLASERLRVDLNLISCPTYKLFGWLPNSANKRPEFDIVVR